MQLSLHAVFRKSSHLHVAICIWGMGSVGLWDVGFSLYRGLGDGCRIWERV
jgi:hypothetical protein